MSTLNELKRLSKEYPNDLKFGAEVRHYLDMNKTCCDKPENLRTYEEFNTHPYGWDVVGKKCIKCGSLIDIKVDR